MKHKILLIASTFIIFSCSTTDENPFLGKWYGTEILISKNNPILGDTTLRFNVEFNNNNKAFFNYILIDTQDNEQVFDYSYNEKFITFIQKQDSLIVNDSLVGLFLSKEFSILNISSSEIILADSLNSDNKIKWLLKKEN